MESDASVTNRFITHFNLIWPIQFILDLQIDLVMLFAV